MKTKLYRIACLILSAVFVMSALLTSCSTEKKKNETVDYLQKIIEKTFDEEAPAPENTRTELIFKPTQSMPVPDLDQVKLVSYSGTSFESAVFAEAVYKGQTTDLSVYSGGKSFIIGSSVFGDTKYGFMAEDLEALLSGIYGDYEQDHEHGTLDPEDGTIAPSSSATGIVSAIDSVISLFEGEYGEKILLLSEKYLDIFADAAASATENKVEVADDITVTVKFNTDCAKKMIKDVFTEAKKDKELKSLIKELLASTGMDESMAEAQIDAILGSDEILNSIYDGLESVPFSLTTVVKADAEYNLTALSVALESSDGTKAKVFFDISDASKMEFGYSTEYFDYDLGELVNDGMLIAVSSSTEEEKASIKVDVSSVISSGGHDLIMGLFSLSLNVDNGAYTLSSDLLDSAVITGPLGMPFEISGTITAEDKKTTVTVTEAKLADNTYETDITLIEETGVTLPQFPTDFKGVLDITEDDLNNIKESAASNPLVAKIAELIQYYSSFEEDYEEDYEEDLEYPEFDF